MRCSTASCHSPTAWLAMMSVTGTLASSARDRSISSILGARLLAGRLVVVAAPRSGALDSGPEPAGVGFGLLGAVLP